MKGNHQAPVTVFKGVCVKGVAVKVVEDKGGRLQQQVKR
jgi:hypothetical protein